MTNSHENITDKGIAKEAQQFSDDLSRGMHESLSTVVQEMYQAQKTMTPAQYKELLTDMNRDLRGVLPGLQIEGILEQNGRPWLAVKDPSGTTYIQDNEEGSHELVFLEGMQYRDQT